MSAEPHYWLAEGFGVDVNARDTTPYETQEEMERLGISSEGIPIDAPDEPEPE